MHVCTYIVCVDYHILSLLQVGGIVYIHTHACIMYVGGDESLTAVSPVRRTVSGTSSDAALMSQPSFPEISVSSMDLASYVHQLRSYLPKASALIDGKPPDGGVAERARVDMDREASITRSQSSDSYAAEFMDRSITSRWDKQKPKVCCSTNLT